MCGICGYISKNEYADKLINEMNNTMYHRGPDDAGVYIGRLSNGMQVALGHRRLSILDLSEAGHQPMFSQDKRYAIVFNGEIYNFAELRKELREKGYVFKSGSDTEVLLYLYAEEGVKCFGRLNGMFAIAIMDFQREKLVLVRDRVGKKPLYYMNDKDGSLVFGSELKVIMKWPNFHKNIRTELISSYIINNSVESPDTIFEGVNKLEPGQYLEWNLKETGLSSVGKAISVEKEYYWDVIDAYKNAEKYDDKDYATIKKELSSLVVDAVQKRLVADVPVGCFLSGGIDSSIVAAYAKKVSEKQVDTFTIGFDNKEKNEAVYASEVAKYLGTNHTELYVSTDDLFEQIRDMVTFYDEPFSDSSQIPSMLVAKLARKNKVVTLTGDGGDELFCGYEKYDWLHIAQKYDWFGNVLNDLFSFPLIDKMNIPNKLPDKMRGFIKNRDKNTKLQLFKEVREKHTPDMVLGESRSSKYVYEKRLHEELTGDIDWQQLCMLMDIRYYLGDVVLQKVDRASMRYSLEERCPLLDHRIIEYSFGIPHKYKYHNGEKKYILKDLLYDEVPKSLIDRPKMGFGVPLASWMRNELAASLKMYSDEAILKKQGIFNYSKIREFIDKLETSDVSLYNTVLWGFYVFQMWYQEYIEDLW